MSGSSGIPLRNFYPLFVFVLNLHYFVFLFVKDTNSVSSEPITLEISVGIIIVLELFEDAILANPSTCLFIISKFTAGCPLSAMALAKRFVWIASALALVVTAKASASAVILIA